VELFAAVALIAFDVLIPALVILAMMVISFLLRRDKFPGLGFRKFSWKMPLIVLGLATGWTLVDVGLLMPILNRITGTTQNVDGFNNLQGNIGQIIFLIAASWTLAALAEEIVFRGYLQKRMIELFPNEKIGIIAAVILTSVMFGFIHLEQGIVGVIISMVDGVFNSVLRWKFKNLWAAVLSHGFINTIGMIAFFFAGPIFSLW
jgi:membrane protease YdiL (CAAX protease family)